VRAQLSAFSAICLRSTLFFFACAGSAWATSKLGELSCYSMLAHDHAARSGLARSRKAGSTRSPVATRFLSQLRLTSVLCMLLMCTAMQQQILARTREFGMMVRFNQNVANMF
jgi:hypothetical protein